MLEREHIVDFISASVQEKPVAAASAFSAAIQDKIASRLNVVEDDVRSGLFNESLKLTFYSDKYKASHGKAPKASVRGKWGFAEVLVNNKLGDDIFVPNAMTLQDAKKWLKNKLKDEGVTGEFEVEILP